MNDYFCFDFILCCFLLGKGDTDCDEGIFSFPVAVKAEGKKKKKNGGESSKLAQLTIAVERFALCSA